jgi:hypothetical protein
VILGNLPMIHASGWGSYREPDLNEAAGGGGRLRVF